MENPLTSIIVVNYCGKNLLKSCLNSIISHTTLTNYEIIIVDNNSNDGSVEFIEENFPNINLIKLNKNYGFAIPNNMAAKTAEGKFLVFLNNDTTVTPNWLSELIKPIEKDKTIVMAQSLLLHPDGSVDSSGDYIDSIGRAHSNHDKPKKIRYILSPRAASMIIRKDAFLELGGFDESYFSSFEDVELGWKAWLWGYKVVVVPKSIVYHTGAQTINQMIETISFHGVKNNIQLRLTNFDFIDSVKSIFLMAFIMITKKLFGVSLVKNYNSPLKIPSFRIILDACLWILKNRSQISKKRKILKARQVVSNEKLREMGLIKTVKTE